MANASINYLNLRPSLATDPLRNFRFVARFTPLWTNGSALNFDAVLGFTAIQGLSMSTEAIPYREGGYNSTVHFLPGQQTFSPVTFQRGAMIGARDHWDWFRMLFDPGMTADSTVKPTDNYRCAITIDVLAHPVANNNSNASSDSVGTDPRRSFLRFQLLNAWPQSISYSDLSASDNAVLVEQMQVVHEGLNIVHAAKPSDGGLFPEGINGAIGTR